MTPDWTRDVQTHPFPCEWPMGRAVSLGKSQVEPPEAEKRRVDEKRRKEEKMEQKKSQTF